MFFYKCTKCYFPLFFRIVMKMVSSAPLRAARWMVCHLARVETLLTLNLKNPWILTAASLTVNAVKARLQYLTSSISYCTCNGVFHLYPPQAV